MTTIAELVSAHGGLLHKHALVAEGATDRHLTAAVRFGGVRRPRRGWYSTWKPDDPRYVAVAVGGRLTGASALHQLGAWMWHRPKITVSVPESASRLRRRRGVRVAWDPVELSTRGTTWSVDPRDALARAVVEADSLEDAVILVDWARQRGVLVDDDDAREVLSRRGADAAGLAEWSDDRAESILESAAGTRLRLAGREIRRQVPVGPRGERIDIVVDGVVALETDGRETHASRFDKDRLKDATMILAGFLPMRASTSMVRDRWLLVAAAVDALASQPLRAADDVEIGESSLPRVLPGRGRRKWRLGRSRRRLRQESPWRGGRGLPAVAGPSA